MMTEPLTPRQLRDIRKGYGLTQLQMGQRMGYYRKNYARRERGDLAIDKRFVLALTEVVRQLAFEKAGLV